MDICDYEEKVKTIRQRKNWTAQEKISKDLKLRFKQADMDEGARIVSVTSRLSRLASEGRSMMVYKECSQVIRGLQLYELRNGQPVKTGDTPLQFAIQNLVSWLDSKKKYN